MFSFPMFLVIAFTLTTWLPNGLECCVPDSPGFPNGLECCVPDLPGLPNGLSTLLVTWILLPAHSNVNSSLTTGRGTTTGAIMDTCVSCHRIIDPNDQSYVVLDMGIELYDSLQQRIHREIDDQSLLCEECFNGLVVAEPLEAENLEQPRISTHNINVCVRCHSRLTRNRHSLVLCEGPERNEIERNSDIQIPLNARICYTCWFQVRRYLQRQMVVDDVRNEVINPAPPIIILENCVQCERSLRNIRTHHLPEGPQRNVIAAIIQPREIPENPVVCYACWVAAGRAVEMERQIQQRRPPPPEQQLEIEPQPEVQPQPEAEPQPHVEPPRAPDHEIIHLDHVKRVSNTSASCFVPGCRNVERLCVPKYLKKRLITQYNIYVGKNARVCQNHRTTYDWEFLNLMELSNVFNKNDLADMHQLMKSSSNIQLNFDNLEELSDDHCKFWTSLTKQQFERLLSEASIPGNNGRLALGLYLLKLRTGEPLRRVASLMRMALSRVCKLINNARTALTSNFVTRHLGVEIMTREELIARNLIIPEGLFGEENTKPIVICDGTYIYVQKSSNYFYQKQTYSHHKYGNLVKPFLIVATDGHIIDAFGPYGANVSDADIMRSLFQDENHPLRSYFENGDVFILDRGFRDSIPLLRALGYSIHKPESLTEGQTQLSTHAANVSRCVTLCRWVVEVVNGRFKRDYKIFRSRFFNLASKHLMEDFRIAAALINAFHPVIPNRSDANEILNRAQERMELPNYLSNFVTQNNMNRRRADFRPIDGIDLSFPEMDMSDLILFSLGTYQIKQARSYYGEHIRQSGSFTIEIAGVEIHNVPMPDMIEGSLIRGRIKSRHQTGRIYYTYLMIVAGDHWSNVIQGYYCSCISGNRTVGCCAHTMTMVWYLGWARHQENIEPPASFLDYVLLREDE